MKESVIEAFRSLGENTEGEVAWYGLRLKGEPEEYALHRNWVAAYGSLKPGERVAYEASSSRLPGEGNGGKGWPLFRSLRKVKEPELEAKPEL
jgi:hypothetical protein